MKLYLIQLHVIRRIHQISYREMPDLDTLKSTLEEISLSKNKITTVEADYFYDFTAIKSINIAENELIQVWQRLYM